MIENSTHNQLGIRMILGGEADGAEFDLEGLWFMERDMIPCDSMTPEPDPSWVFTDGAGHTHRWAKGDNPGSYDLPTLNYTVTGESGHDDGCGQTDFIIEGEYRCRDCGEVVLPGTRTPEPGRMVAGPVRWSAEVEMAPELLVTMPRSWLDNPISVRTPVGRGTAYVVEVVPGDRLGWAYTVKLRGVGGLTLGTEGEDDV